MNQRSKEPTNTQTHDASQPGELVVLALHGHGESAASARQWAYGILPPTTTIHTLQADVSAQGVRSWFETGPYGVVPQDLAATIQRVQNKLTELHDLGHHVILAGFSQGGAVVLGAMYLHVQCIAAMAFCSFFPEVDWDHVRSEFEVHSDATDDPLSTPTLIVGRTEDPDVPSFFSEDAHAFLESSGYNSNLRILSGGHEVSEVVRSTAREWLRDVSVGVDA